MICEDYSNLDFKTLFPHSKYEFSDDGKLTQIDVNLNKSIISNIKIGTAGDQVKITFSNNNGKAVFCPQNWIIRKPEHWTRFSEKYIYEACSSDIYYCIEMFFDDINNLNKKYNNCPKFIVSKAQIEQYVDNLAYGIIKQFEKNKIAYDFSLK